MNVVWQSGNHITKVSTRRLAALVTQVLGLTKSGFKLVGNESRWQVTFKHKTKGASFGFCGFA